VAVGRSVAVEPWSGMLEELLGRVAGRFPRIEPRRRIRGFVLGLLADLPRKNCWTIAEHAGDASPDGMQHLLGRGVWDTDGVRDDLREFVMEHLGDPHGVLVVDETGDVKKGSCTVGAQRQYTGTAGRVENAQVAVYLTYAGPAGHAMIDRELYLPRSWTDDPARCASAGVPEEVEFATKPALAGAMITRALDAGVPARWVTGDEVYGADPGLRAELQTRQVGYVLATGCDRRVPTAAGSMRPDTLATSLPKGAWQRLSAGPGAKGQRYYDWAWVTLTAESGHHWLLIRRHPRHGELAFYRCYSPTLVPLGELVRVAGRRWTIEETFQAAKGLAGLDEHQVRRWLAWRRWTLLAMLAHALLAVIAATERAQCPPPDELIALTCNEIRHLLTRLITEPTQRLPDPLDWSRWRRHHQHHARACHYRHQEAQLT
jgi:SRSO17 transposase